MKTKIVSLTIGLLILGIMLSTVGTGMLPQQANAAACSTFVSGGVITKTNCSSDQSFTTANTQNQNNHFK